MGRHLPSTGTLGPNYAVWFSIKFVRKEKKRKNKNNEARGEGNALSSPRVGRRFGAGGVGAATKLGNLPTSTKSHEQLYE